MSLALVHELALRHEGDNRRAACEAMRAALAANRTMPEARAAFELMKRSRLESAELRSALKRFDEAFPC